jgi:hypothetical protein
MIERTYQDDLISLQGELLNTGCFWWFVPKIHWPPYQ